MSFKFNPFKKNQPNQSASIEDVIALFGEAAQAEGFNLTESIEQGLAASALLNETAAAAFPDTVADENFDFKGEVIGVVGLKTQIDQAIAAKVEAENKLNAITELFGDAANAEGFDVTTAVQTAVEESAQAQEAIALFGEEANAEGFSLPEATKLKIERVTELEKKGGGSRTNTKSKAKSGADNDEDDSHDFLSYEHNRKVMAEVKDLETYQSPKQESK